MTKIFHRPPSNNTADVTFAARVPSLPSRPTWAHLWVK